MLFSQDSGLYHQVSVGLAPNTSVWPGDLSKCHAYYFVMVLDSIRIVIINFFMDGTYTNFPNIPKPYNENLPEIMVHSISYQVDLVLWLFTLIVSKEGTNMVYLSWWIGFETFHSFKQGKSEGFDSCDRPSNLKLDSNRQFFCPCDREIWWMTLQNNRAPLLCYFKLCASFCTHWWIQT